jgi:hypothetical protein
MLRDYVLKDLHEENLKLNTNFGVIYSKYAGKNVDIFIKVMRDLESEGLIIVGKRSWVWGGDSQTPIDIVIEGVKLTHKGIKKAERIRQQKQREIENMAVLFL